MLCIVCFVLVICDLLFAVGVALTGYSSVVVCRLLLLLFVKQFRCWYCAVFVVCWSLRGVCGSLFAVCVFCLLIAVCCLLSAVC